MSTTALSPTPYGLTHQVIVPPKDLLAGHTIAYDMTAQMSTIDGIPSHLHPKMGTVKVTPLGPGKGSKSDESD